MNKRLIMLVNVFFTLSILLFVIRYSSIEAERVRKNETAAFESLTAAMGKVTVNYLIGEQRVCDSWASTLNRNHPHPRTGRGFPAIRGDRAGGHGPNHLYR